MNPESLLKIPDKPVFEAVEVAVSLPVQEEVPRET